MSTRSFIRPAPYGVVLIMNPWNYPYLLSVEPAIDAIAAGNTVMIKPSAYSPQTSAVLAEMLAEALPQELCAVITGGRMVDKKTWLDLGFRYRPYTGMGEQLIKMLLK